MEENKNIDRLYQEKMKNLEVLPGPHVWSAIEGRIKKKKRRVLPIWWYSGSIAALFILGIFLFQSPKNNLEFQKKEQPVITTAPEKTNAIKKDSTVQFSQPVEKEEINIAKKKLFKNESKKNKNARSSINEKTSLIAKQDPINKKEFKGIKHEKEDQVSKKIISPIFSKKELKNDEKKTDSIQKKKPDVKKDIIASLQQNDSLLFKENRNKKWAISPVLAVLNSNSFSKSSPIASDLNENPKRGGYTFSYGVKIAYQLNSKWSVQSGIHLQKMNFTTKNVFIASGVSQSNVETINFNNSDSYFFSNANLNSSDISDFGANAISVSHNAQLEQTFGYIEIPFEIKYQFLEKKNLKTNLITGFSSLFLTENQIKATSGTFYQVFGEANNLNSVNFSMNLGFDIDYTINKYWTLNINPMMKTQLNTFSKNSNGFNPFFLGFYTGIKYQF